MNKNVTKLIIHGHFYQPPRENANSNIIDIQESATPYLNWNENIFYSCYKPNAYSRYLDETGRIISINNNYSYLSCNFGPTLLRWIEENHINTYNKILEADKISVKRLGHGNMIAQVYNHTILPLDNINDAKLQITWALNDFKRRFKRDSEGLWLSETAINKDVVDILYEKNVKFVILSPYQATSYIDENNVKHELNGSPIPYDKPYYIEGNKHKIVGFFYNGDLASSISFAHMLRDADSMYNTLVDIKNKDNCKLLHTATDGEIYGHHESFGDMAYCALVKKVLQRDDFEITNYGKYLEDTKVTHTAILNLGQDNNGSSWSCYHGVLRWYDDCGCHTGGVDTWNQKWRTPLRKALQIIRDYSDLKLKEANVKQDLLDNLDLVLSNNMDMQTYLSKEKNKKEIAKALVSKALSCYSFTSCGWFFNDISGIEPVKNIDYAYQVLSLYPDKDIEKKFLDTLEEAKSNISGNGKTYALETKRKINIFEEAGVYFAILRSLGDTKITKYGYINLLDFKKENSTYVLKVYHTNLLDTKIINIDLIRKEDDFIAKVNNTYISYKNDINLLRFKADAKKVLDENLNYLDLNTIKKRSEILNNLSTLDSMLKQEKKYYSNFARHTLDSLFRIDNVIDYSLVNSFLNTIDQSSSFDDKKLTLQILNKYTKKLARELHNLKEEQIISFINICRANNFEIDLTYLQDEVYSKKDSYSNDLLSLLNFRV